MELRGDIAAQDARIKREIFEREKWRLFEKVKKAYFEYAYLHHAIRIVKENIRLLKDLENVLRRQYESGKASYGSLIRIQTEIARFEDRLNSLNELRDPIVSELNSALNRPVDSPLPWPKPIYNCENKKI